MNLYSVPCSKMLSIVGSLKARVLELVRQAQFTNMVQYVTPQTKNSIVCDPPLPLKATDTALIRASRHGHLDVVNLLLSNGAKVNLTGHVSHTTKMGGCMQCHHSMMLAALHDVPHTEMVISQCGLAHVVSSPSDVPIAEGSHCYCVVSTSSNPCWTQHRSRFHQDGTCT